MRRHPELLLDPAHHANILGDAPADHEVLLHADHAEQPLDALGDALAEPGEDFAGGHALAREGEDLGLGEHDTRIADLLGLATGLEGELAEVFEPHLEQRGHDFEGDRKSTRLNSSH